MSVLIVGRGTMGRAHQRVLMSLGEQVHTVDPREEAGADFASVEEAPASEITCVTVPPKHLASVARVAIAKGSHVLVEKPMALNGVDAQGLVDLAEEKEVTLAVGYTERHNPAVHALVEHFHLVGRVRRIVGKRLSPPPERRTQGPIIDLATHELDMLRNLGYFVHQVRAVPPNTFLLNLGPVAGVIEVSHEHTAKVRTLTVVGVDGRLELDYQRQTLEFYGDTHMDIPVERVEPLASEWRDFLTAIRESRSPRCSGADGVAALKLALGCEKAIVGQAFTAPKFSVV